MTNSMKSQIILIFVYLHLFSGRKMWSNQYSVSILKGNDCVTIEYYNPLCFQSIYSYFVLDEENIILQGFFFLKTRQ